MKAFLVALIAALVVSSAYAYSFTGNVSFTNDNGVFNYRRTTFTNLEILKIAGFRSIAINLNGTEQSGSIDTLGGIVFYKNLPAAMLSYWSGEFDFDPNSFSVDTSKGLMGQVFAALTERDANGNDLHTYTIGTASFDGDSWDINTDSNEDQLWWVENSASINHFSGNASFDIKVTWLVSAQLGKIDLANTELNPRTLESVLRITNYPYVDPSNTLTLTVGAASGSASSNIDGGNIANGADGDNSRIFVNLAAEAHIVADGNALTGNVKATVNTQWTKNNDCKSWFDDLKVWLDAHFNSNWDAHVANVTFDAGAANIVYDPAMGNLAKNSQAPVSSAADVIPSMAFVAILISLLAWF